MIGKIEKAAGVSQGYFSTIARMKQQNPSANVVYVAAKMLDVTMEEIFSEPLYLKDREKEIKAQMAKLQEELDKLREVEV